MLTTAQSRRMSLVTLSIAACAALWLGLAPARGLAGPPASVTWTFDRLDRIGGHLTTVEGNPKVIETPVGKARIHWVSAGDSHDDRQSGGAGEV